MTNNKIFSDEEKRNFAIKMKQIIKFCMANKIYMAANYNSYSFWLNGKRYLVTNYNFDDYKKYLKKLSNQGFSPAAMYLKMLENEYDDNVIRIQASKLRIMEIYNDLKAGKQLDKNGREIMKTSEIEFKMDDIYYITQYSEFYYDKNVLEAFNYNLQNFKTLEEQIQYKNKIIEIIGKMGYVEDKINEKIYHRLVSSNETNLSNLEQYNLLLKTLSNDDWINQSDNTLKYGFSNFANDNNYLDKDAAWEIVDGDLKENGMDSQYIYSFNNFNEITDPLYANDPYVYVDPYLRVHNVTEDKIKGEYIDYVCDNNKFETLEEKKEYKAKITGQIKNMGDDWINECEKKFKHSVTDFMWEENYVLREQLIEDIDNDLKKHGENSKWICASNNSNALYDDRKYVYIDPYLHFHSVSESELREAYIDSISEMKLEDVLNLDVSKMENKASDTKNILSEFDKTPTSFEESEVIKEYKKSFNEKSNNNENIKSNSIKR